MFSQIEKRDNRITHLETQTATLADRMMKTHINAIAIRPTVIKVMPNP